MVEEGEEGVVGPKEPHPQVLLLVTSFQQTLNMNFPLLPLPILDSDEAEVELPFQQVTLLGLRA